MILVGGRTGSGGQISGKPVARDTVALGTLQTGADSALEAVKRQNRRAQRKDQQTQWRARSGVCWPSRFQIEEDAGPANEPDR